MESNRQPLHDTLTDTPTKRSWTNPEECHAKKRRVSAESAPSSPVSLASDRSHVASEDEKEGASVDEHFLRSIGKVPTVTALPVRRPSPELPLKSRKLPASFFRQPPAAPQTPEYFPAPSLSTAADLHLTPPLPAGTFLPPFEHVTDAQANEALLRQIDAIAWEYDALLRLFSSDIVRVPLVRRSCDPVMSSTICCSSDETLCGLSPCHDVYDPTSQPGLALSPSPALALDDPDLDLTCFTPRSQLADLLEGSIDELLG
eukprot:comp22139_c0_seq1/m.32402 comp22139_c0_seq1/g.32402  ORF comp22139_c0_seq1/g.32402 comp22139_c0_seq1/m.32402 type:complete len:259 (-) comp22139_c0_seq1:413-1189(-)